MAELTRRDIAAERRGRGGTRPIRHGQLPRHGGARSVLSFVAAALAVVLVATVSLVGIAAWQFGSALNDNRFALNEDGAIPAVQVGAVEGGFNLLVVGADNDETQGDAYGERGATLNDVNILLHVSDDHTTATAVSFPRDLIVAHPTCTDPETEATYGAMSARPLNEAISRGGMSCVVKTIEQLTGLEIAYAAQFSFRAVVKMTDAIGGIEVCVGDDIVDPKAGLELEAGLQSLSGKKALGFLRTRHGVGDGSDLSRISVQQVYMSALARTIKSADTLSNPVKLYGLATAASQNVYLSDTLQSLDTMVAMAKTMTTIDLDNLNFLQYPGSTGSKAYPGKVVPDVAQAKIMMDAITADRPVSAASLGRGSKVDEAADEAPDEPVPAATEPAATAQPTAEPSEAPTVAPTGTPTPTPTAVTVETNGQSASVVTCSRGYLK